MPSTVLLPKVAVAGLLLTALQIVATAPPAAAAAVRWASPTGAGAACTEVAPCTLETAVEDDAVVDGDEVVVMPGDYTVSSLDVWDAITVHGQVGQARPTITTTGGFGVFVSDAATLRDLDFVHTNSSNGVSVNAANAVVERVTSRMTVAGGIACSPGKSSTWRDSVCWATGTNTRGMGVNNPSMISSHITLRNLTIVGEAYGLGLDYSGVGTDVVVDAKNVIASSPGFDVRALVTNGAIAQITMESSNFADSTADVAAGGGTVTVTEPGTGTNQTEAPVFVDAANGDFHQAEGSPTIDAGVADASNGTTDFEGDPRALRGTAAACPERVDIGADERVTVLECHPPETSFASGPEGSTTDATPTFGLSSDEAGTFECRVDDGAFAPCASPWTPATLALGAHTVQARAVDASGNVDESPATRSVTVVEPDTAFTRTPKKKVRTAKTKAKVTFAFTSTGGVGFECSLDGAAFKPCASPRTFKAKLGKHQMRVRAVSAEGVVDPTPATYAFKVKRKVTRQA